MIARAYFDEAWTRLSGEGVCDWRDGESSDYASLLVAYFAVGAPRDADAFIRKHAQKPFRMKGALLAFREGDDGEFYQIIVQGYDGRDEFDIDGNPLVPGLVYVLREVPFEERLLDGGHPAVAGPFESAEDAVAWVDAQPRSCGSAC